MLTKRLKKHSSRGLYFYITHSEVDVHNLKNNQKMILMDEKEFKDIIKKIK